MLVALIILVALYPLQVTVTSLHPLRLCRIAVFSLKPTFLSNPSTLVGLGSPPPGGEGLKPGGLVSSNKFPCHTNRSSFFNFPIAQDRSHGIGGCGAPDQHQHRRTPTPDQETVAKFVCMSAFLLLVVTPYQYRFETFFRKLLVITSEHA